MNALINDLRARTALGRLNVDECSAVFDCIEKLGYKVVRKDESNGNQGKR